MVFASMPENVQAYANFLDSEQRENGKDYEELPDFEEWLESLNITA